MVFEDFSTNAELLTLLPLKTTTRGVEVYNTVKEFFRTEKGTIGKPVAVTIDGALAMIGRHAGFLNHCKGDLARLRPPKYFRSVLISLQYYIWVCGISVGFLRPNFVRPISKQREWLKTMRLKSALVDGHLHAQCLVC